MSAFTTYTDAVNTMLDVLKTVWVAQTIIVPAPFISWPNLFDGQPPEATKYWVKVWLRSNSDVQRTIGRPAIYTMQGYLYIQCFSPLDDQEAGATLRALVEVVKDAYTSKTINGVRFPSVLIREMASEAKWHSHRVAAEYSFDYLK